MKIYVASAFDQRWWVRTIESVLEAQGWDVLSTWQWVTDEDAQRMTMEQEREWAITNLEAIRHADALVVFVAGQSAGGMWTEMGYANALGLPILVVGDSRNVFCHLVPCVSEGQWFDALQKLVLQKENNYVTQKV